MDRCGQAGIEYDGPAGLVRLVTSPSDGTLPADGCCPWKLTPAKQAAFIGSYEALLHRAARSLR